MKKLFFKRKTSEKFLKTMTERGMQAIMSSYEELSNENRLLANLVISYPHKRLKSTPKEELAVQLYFSEYSIICAGFEEDFGCTCCSFVFRCEDYIPLSIDYFDRTCQTFKHSDYIKKNIAELQSTDLQYDIIKVWDYIEDEVLIYLIYNATKKYYTICFQNFDVQLMKEETESFREIFEVQNKVS